MGWLSGLFSKKPKFDVGDIVKCIDDRDHEIKFGQEYKVLDRIKTTCCGIWVYDVGLRQGNTRTQCICTSRTKMPGAGIHWAKESRFAFLRKEKARAKSEEAISIETKEILEEEIAYVGNN